MKNTLLITTAIVALVAGANLASAQRVEEQRGAPAATTAPEQKSSAGKADEQKHQKSDSAKPAPHAQARDAQSPGTTTRPKSVTSGQETPAKSSQKDDARPPSKTDPKRSPESAQLPGKTDSPNAAVQGESKAVASKPLSPEQHAKIRDSLRGEKSEHLARADFSISVGAWVPRTIRLNAFPAQFVESFPQYRDYEYIMVSDEILIVDPRTLQIIAVIPA
jgi:Protein of unknown function (DUF1236)